jgi:hypothetical protein
MFTLCLAFVIFAGVMFNLQAGQFSTNIKARTHSPRRPRRAVTARLRASRRSLLAPTLPCSRPRWMRR